MSIQHINLENYKQNFDVSLENKSEFGEINTPFNLINKILDLLPPHLFEDFTLKWLDPGTGHGYFSMVLFHRLFKSLSGQISNPDHRAKHIIQHMLYMVEVNKVHIPHLKELFGHTANIFNSDFLSTNRFETATSYNVITKFDVIIGNPPYNSQGLKKTPTNTQNNKKKDGKTIWIPFVKHAMNLLKTDGYLTFITPSIWMKPDRAHMHQYLTQYDIQKLHCLNNTQTNRIFFGQAQTPTCYFLLRRCETTNQIAVYDNDIEAYINYPVGERPIPVFGVSVIAKLLPFVDKVGCLKVKKTNMPRSLDFIEERKDEYKYANISTCVLTDNKPQLKINYSRTPQPFHGLEKLVLAHKMWGYSYWDKGGFFGISQRDNYVILGKEKREFQQIQDFLSTKFAFYVFESTRYRMKYLEKYAFEFLPDITKLEDFPEKINDETIANYFGLTEREKEAIEKLQNRRSYKKKSTITTTPHIDPVSQATLMHSC